MKVSKVEHTRIATQVKQGDGQGVLYRNPSREKSAELDLGRHVKRQLEKAQGFYNPINTPSSAGKMSDEQKELSKLIKQFCDVTMSCIRNNSESTYQNFSNELRKKPYANPIERINGSAEDIAALIVDKYLRKSLRRNVAIRGEKYSVEEAIRNILADYINRNNSKAISTETDYEVFFSALKKDYFGQSKLESIPRSIEKRDVKIQVVDKNGVKLVAPSNYCHEKIVNGNDYSKRYVFDFMKEYSSYNFEGREKMLIHMKELIMLFYCGHEGYQASNLSAWSWGNEGPDNAFQFSDELYSVIDELFHLSADFENAVKKKQHYDQIKDIVNLNHIKKEIDSLNAKKRNLTNQKDRCVSASVKEHFVQAKNEDGLTASDIYWLTYISNVAENILCNANTENYKISVGYLCDKTYKEWLSYVALKFVEMGKGVYHFVLPDFDDISAGISTSIGTVRPEYENGITSFDYEYIKARESLSRDLSVQATFAVATFANAVAENEYRLRKNKEDVLLYDKKDWVEATRKDARRRIFAFWGGQSEWSDSETDMLSDEDIIDAFSESISYIRNQNFHYAKSDNALSENTREAVRLFFEREYSKLGAVFRKKYFSNSIPAFYPVSDINKLMDSLYAKTDVRELQIPAFGNVVKKKDNDEFIRKYVMAAELSKISTTDGTLEKFRAGFYFVMKEIYYHAFLTESNLKERFLRGVEGISKLPEGVKNRAAYEDFSKRIKELCSNSDTTFGTICQSIMTEHNQQNQGNYKIKSQTRIELNRKAGIKQKYEHYPLLLQAAIRCAFEEYIRERREVFEFLKHPICRPEYLKNDRMDEFCNNWKTNCFAYLNEIVKKSDDALAWYVVAHFLSNKRINHLQGSIKDYRQYVSDISRREHSVLQKRIDGSDEGLYADVLSILDFVMLFAGAVSNVFEDYFEDENDYVAYINNFVQIANKKEVPDVIHLKAFSEANRCLTYYDGQNPKINRNIINAMLYGNDKIIANSFTKITGMNIAAYNKEKAAIEAIFTNGRTKAKTVKEQNMLCDLQGKKNRIELFDVSMMSDMIDDYMAQLVSYSYLRERDLMYFQLGAEYVRLFWTDSVPADSKLRKLSGENIDIRDGAVLYQIAAMYTHNLPVYECDSFGKNAIAGKKGSAGAGVSQFVSAYCGELLKPTDVTSMPPTYFHCMELFEDITLHDKYTNLRNEIDHLKYLVRANKSILDLYSDVFSGFLNYDTKLRKSVSYIFSNIASKYFILPELSFKGVSNEVENDFKQNVERHKSTIAVTDVKSDCFSYKNLIDETDNKKKAVNIVMIEARNKELCKDIKKMLGYKE